jgi:lambda family phage minor tail protein L
VTLSRLDPGYVDPTPRREIASLDPGAIIELFVLDASDPSIGGGLTYFHAGTNDVWANIVWQGNTYQAFPIKAEGFEITGKGTLPRPKLTVAAVDGLIGLMIRDYDDLVGATLIRKRTLAKFLPTGSSPNPNAYLPDDVFVIERKALETKDFISFELASKMDAQGLKLPRRVIQATICPWVYKGYECTYTGALATCNKTLNDATGDGGCLQHFGQTTPLPYGGFPGAGLVR